MSWLEVQVAHHRPLASVYRKKLFCTRQAGSESTAFAFRKIHRIIPPSQIRSFIQEVRSIISYRIVWGHILRHHARIEKKWTIHRVTSYRIVSYPDHSRFPSFSQPSYHSDDSCAKCTHRPHIRSSVAQRLVNLSQSHHLSDRKRVPHPHSLQPSWTSSISFSAALHSAHLHTSPRSHFEVSHSAPRRPERIFFHHWLRG